MLHPAELHGLRHRIAVELLGLHHQTPRQFADDSRRAADALEQGIVMLAVPNAELLADVDAFVLKLAAVARSWGWSG